MYIVCERQYCSEAKTETIITVDLSDIISKALENDDVCQLTILDESTGAPLVVMSGETLSAIRAVLATKTIAKEIREQIVYDLRNTMRSANTIRRRAAATAQQLGISDSEIEPD